MMFWIPGKNQAARLAATNSFAERSRRVDQWLIIRPDCGGLQNANAIYFDSITGCMRNCSLRIQTMLSNRSFTSSPVASLRRWREDSAAAPAGWQRRHRLQVEVRPDRSVRATANRPASCRATPPAAAARRVRAPGQALPGAGCREESPAEAQSVYPAWPAGFWRFDWHLDRGFAMVARSGMRTGHRHVSLHWFCSDNDSDAAMFRSAALNAQAEPVQISQVFAGLFHQPFQRRQDPRAIWTAEPRACIPAGAGAVRAIVAFADIAENAGRQILVQNRIEEPERLSQ